MVTELALNKITLLSASIFGMIFLPLVLLMQGKVLDENISEGFKCIIGIECELLPVFIISYVLTLGFHHYMLSLSREFKEGQRTVYM